MWKSTAGHNIPNAAQDADDDWETDTDFVNDVTEQEQRWGSKTVEGSGRTAGAIDMNQFRHETEQADAERKKKDIVEQNPGFGYGGKFGVEHDRMDQSAVGHDYVGKVAKHASQTDYSDGFGGKFGVQSDRVDKSAMSWDHKEKVEKHSSQKDYATGFGGKFGVQNDRVDKSAVGWDHIEKVEKHESQKDYSHGFGGKFGVQDDRKDKSAVGWDHIEKVEKHESQVDHKVGFGGKFGVQNDRMDRSAVGFQENPEKIGTNYTKTKPDIGGAKPSNLRAKFENLAKVSEEENHRRAAEQKKLREEKDRLDRDAAAKKTSFETSESAEKPATGRRVAIETGRTGGIGSAISAFNQVQSPTTETAPAQRKAPIQLPKEVAPVAASSPATPPPTPAATQAQFAQPDVIPIAAAAADERRVSAVEVADVAIADVAAPPPAEFANSRSSHNGNAAAAPAPEEAESLYANVEQTRAAAAAETPAATAVVAASAAPAELVAADNSAAPEENIYQNAAELTECIDDTGIRAIALYDYEAAADDEISFDPDDLITHIEQIDEGWWRGLCKNRYGLFPANYVQLQPE